jgi:predicted negative regulator of RcsB-dependent stress response
LTRHELKEQLQHDPLKDNVFSFLNYASAHREKLIRWSVIAGVVLILAGLALWFASYRRAMRQEDLQAAFAVLEAPVGTETSAGKSFPTQDAKAKAAQKAFADVVSKDGGTREGLIAQYYLGTLKAQNQDSIGAEADLRAVASTSNDCAPLAKIALAQLYAGQNRMADAQKLLREVVDKPTDLVSKAQAELLLAQFLQSTNPKEAQKIVQSLKAPDQRPAITRAADQLASQSAK